MIIKELKIKNFGKLKDKTITFDNGCNVIFGNNESGKTTIITFIRFMIYGGQGRVNPVKDYFPLDLTEPSGEMVISHNDTQYLIVRNGAKKKGCYAVITNLDTGDVITGEKAENMISEIVNIGEDMFSSTIYVKDISESTFLAKSEILKRLENLSSSGDELVNFEEIISLLNEEKLSLTSAKRKDAIIPRLMRDLGNVENEISSLKDKIYSKSALETDLKKAIAEEQELTAYVGDKDDEADNMLYKLNQSIVDLNTKISDTERIIPQEFLAYNETDGEVVEKCEKLLGSNLEYIIYCVLTVCTVASFVSGIIPYIIFVASLVFGFGSFLYFNNAKKKLNGVLSRYNAKNGDDLKDKFKFFKEKSSQLLSFKNRRDELNSEISQLNMHKENKKNILADNMRRTVDAVTRKNRIEAELETITRYEKLLTEKELTYKEIKEGLEKNSEYVKIIDDTKELITNAYEKLKKDFSPVVSEMAGKIFSFVTENSDEKIVVSSELALSLRRNEGFFSPTNLSRSTLDLLYFSFRMAVIETVIDKSGVVIFDEAFIRYDKERLSRIMSYLGLTSHQIIFTTFSEYELKFLEDKCDYNLIKL